MLRQGGTSTSLVSNGRRKVHTTFEDESEMVEEYDAATEKLLVRKRRGKTLLGRQLEWEYLVGEAPRLFNPHTTTLAPSLDNPLVSRCDTAREFVWRVRNVPWPADVYSVTVEADARAVVVRTSNRKFFKRLQLPELDAAALPLSPAAMTWHHSGATLVISYRKPPEVLAAEAAEAAQRKTIAPGRPEADGDVDCKQQ